jgi:hypothetical protein
MTSFKSRWLVIPMVAGTLLCSAAQAQSYVNVTVGGRFAPGVYGQVAIGNSPPPPVVNAQPVIVERTVYAPPVVYMHVPAQESRDWGRHCGHYGACGYAVHFVQVDEHNRWWEHQREYLRDERGYRREEHDRGRHYGNGHGNGRDQGRWDQQR